MENDLYHHGVKGMHWGVRRYQNEDGSLTEAGLKKYKKTSDKIERAKLASAKYKYNAATERIRAEEYEQKRDKTKTHLFQTDISIARENKFDRKRTRSEVNALKYEERAAMLTYKAAKWSKQNERLLSMNASAAVRASNRAAAEEFVRLH